MARYNNIYHIVPKMIRDKVVYLPHDDKNKDRLEIGDTKFNHVEICRLHILLERILYGST